VFSGSADVEPDAQGNSDNLVFMLLDSAKQLLAVTGVVAAVLLSL